ncbi:LuxR C-terminal-related transcriptional regulator [Streptomyces sp. NPDC017936]|uniref:LuxR C-terminal-related transcriptional regulator n=1 Tax=Streptomyces sp. NPDC017936 TaxID=3365016 RepID=UPI00379961F1
MNESDPGAEQEGVDPAGVPFLRTRFSLPTRPATFLHRERLAERLDPVPTTPLTVVSGSAGAGKTLLVADRVATLDAPVAWLTCDATDRAPGIFWAYVLEALRATGVPVTSGIGCPAEASRVDHNLLARLAAGLADRDRPVVLVLDEYDQVTTPEVAEQLRFVLDHAGPGLRLVLVTRVDPLLPLHRYRAAGEMTEVRDADLAFTPEEASDLLTLHGLSLPADSVRALVRRTQGWAAGLRLCALAAQQSDDPETYLKEFEAGHSTVADFLLAEVLERQRPERQDVLLRVSVLDRFSPGLVNALTLRSDAEATLAGLHRENAFLQDLGHSWYRLHPLFAEILQVHLRERSPGLEPQLRRRAAHWLRRSGTLAEALAQGAAADDWEFAAHALVDDLAIGQIFTGLHSQDLSDVFGRMSPETTGPAANLVRAARELAHHDLEHGLAHLRGAEEALRTTDGTGTAPARLSCALLQALAARLTGSPDLAEEAARAAQALRREVPAHLLDAHPEVTALLLTHLGAARLWAGRFEAASAALSAVADCPGGASTALPRLEALGQLALIDHLSGRPGRAERRALAAAAEAERHGLPPHSGSGIGRLVLAAVAVDRDELDRAQLLLDEVNDCRDAPWDPVMETGWAVVRGRLFLARGDARAALETTAPRIPAAVPSPWAEEHTALVASAAHLAQGRPEAARKVLEPVMDHRAPCTIEAARARLAEGRPAEALDLIDHLPDTDRPGPAVTVRACLVRAQAAHQAGDPGTARRLVARALLEARHDRLRRPFREAGSWIRPLLDSEPLRGSAQGWLVSGPAPHGRAPRGPAAPAAPSAPLVVEELSARELDVLRRLAQMMSTEEIAADLYLSVNTVKTHLKSVYRKLAVNRRNDAVRRARDLRLL